MLVRTEADGRLHPRDQVMTVCTPDSTRRSKDLPPHILITLTPQHSSINAG